MGLGTKEESWNHCRPFPQNTRTEAVVTVCTQLIREQKRPQNQQALLCPLCAILVS